MTIAACVAINLVANQFADALHLPVFLDMVGTAIAALALGPWMGALVGVATNFGAVPWNGWSSAPFAVVNVAGALLWGFGWRRTPAARTLKGFLRLNLAVAGLCTAISVPLLLVAFGGSVGHDESTIASLISGRPLELPPVLALTVSNLTASVMDKLICGFVAVAVVEAPLLVQTAESGQTRTAPPAL